MNDEYLPLMDAAKYLGVSRVKLSQMAKDGDVPVSVNPLDKRVKLFKRADLDAAKRVRPVIREEATSS